MDVLGSPVPALVGVQAPFDPFRRENTFDGVVVLNLDASKPAVRTVFQHYSRVPSSCVDLQVDFELCCAREMAIWLRFVTFILCCN